MYNQHSYLFFYILLYIVFKKSKLFLDVKGYKAFSLLMSDLILLNNLKFYNNQNGWLRTKVVIIPKKIVFIVSNKTNQTASF